jgi:hypothetical protein
MRFPRFAATTLVLVATSALAIAACGGSVPTDLFSDPGADSGATADGSSGGGGVVAAAVAGARPTAASRATRT